MAEPRSYQQNCGLAHSLDLIGERWTLLVVRELARGPKRFRDLINALAGMGTNLLAARLKRLEAADIAERVELAPGVKAYGLTVRGEGLVHALGELLLWGLELPQMLTPGYETRAVWLAMSMQASMDRTDSPAPEGTYAFSVGDEAFWLRVTADRSQLRDGAPPYPPDAALTIAPWDFFRAAIGNPLDELQTTIEGDGRRLAELLVTFRIPTTPVGAAGILS